MTDLTKVSTEDLLKVLPPEERVEVRTPPPPVEAREDYLTTLEDVIPEASKAILRHGVPAAGGFLGMLAGSRVPGASVPAAGAGEALGKLVSQKLLGEPTDLGEAAVSGVGGAAAGPVAKGASSLLGMIRRAVGQKGVDLATISKGVEASAPTLGPTRGTVEGVQGAVQGRAGKIAAQDAMSDAIGRKLGDVGLLRLPSMGEEAVTLEQVLQALRDLGLRQMRVGTARDTVAAAQAGDAKTALLQELYQELSNRPNAPQTVLQAIRNEYAKAMEVRRSFGGEGTGALPSAVNLGAGRRGIDIVQLAKNLIAREPNVGGKVNQALDPLRQAAYRGTIPGHDTRYAIPVPFAWKVGMNPGRIPLPFTKYHGNALRNPSPLGLDAGLRLLGESRE